MVKYRLRVKYRAKVRFKYRVMVKIKYRVRVRVRVGAVYKGRPANGEGGGGGWVVLKLYTTQVFVYNCIQSYFVYNCIQNRVLFDTML